MFVALRVPCPLQLHRSVMLGAAADRSGTNRQHLAPTELDGKWVVSVYKHRGPLGLRVAATASRERYRTPKLRRADSCRREARAALPRDSPRKSSPATRGRCSSIWSAKTPRQFFSRNPAGQYHSVRSSIETLTTLEVTEPVNSRASSSPETPINAVFIPWGR